MRKKGMKTSLAARWWGAARGGLPGDVPADRWTPVQRLVALNESHMRISANVTGDFGNLTDFGVGVGLPGSGTS